MSSSPFTYYFSKPFHNCFYSYWVQILECMVPWKYWLRNAKSLDDDHILRHSTKSRCLELSKSLQYLSCHLCERKLEDGTDCAPWWSSGCKRNIKWNHEKYIGKKPHPQKIFIFSFSVVYGRMDVYGLSTGAAGMVLCSMRSFQTRALWYVRWKVSWHVEFKIIFV